jgi:hypothetical protein
MKNLYEPRAAAEVKERIARLTPESQRAWGSMGVAQMLAHCSASMETAVGDSRPPRLLAGRIIAPFVRRMMLGEKPVGRNAPTAPGLRVPNERDFAAERDRLTALVDRFASGGPAACTTHPHTFFGALRPEEWARWMYKHLDHHLRQFQV